MLPKGETYNHKRSLTWSNSYERRLVDRRIFLSENRRTDDTGKILGHEVQSEFESPAGGCRGIWSKPNRHENAWSEGPKGQEVCEEISHFDVVDKV